ncbi:hypothetical protein PAXRUDRAFT_835876 [Paxillus rubicundulus Ve08.2h10]|uniref:Unplaced genomic scaffold scaffold_3700, whole genome shotgun sequence n=1 Tax=Paxillus rubicundulus Ve08.2h10 TaxID=930991 RepID=A0A0D0D4D6_9AGAM|nr:hypothetical protein PAXRUDRAFT_835876 [Paxillus rubicundulus Ve08.2h10]
MHVTLARRILSARYMQDPCYSNWATDSRPDIFARMKHCPDLGSLVPRRQGLEGTYIVRMPCQDHAAMLDRRRECPAGNKYYKYPHANDSRPKRTV